MSSPEETSGLGKCPTRETLLAYSKGDLRPADMESISTHIRSCSRCQTTINASISNSETDKTEVQEARGESEPRGIASRGLPTRSATTDAISIRIPQPERLRDYQLLRKLGQGGMGEVYQARHLRLDNLVAIKLLPPNRLGDDHSIARFEREMRAIGRLKHPNIVQALDAGEEQGVHYLVMEYVQGEDLAEIVRRQGPLRIPEACEVIRQAATGLQAAHEAGLVHRDIKPSNLILSRSGAVKLLDLGLARVHSEDRPGEELTGFRQVIGTTEYMAPEQAADTHSADIRADIYSLGCTFYKLLTGRAPFSGPQYDTPIKQILAHAQAQWTPVSELCDDIPGPIVTILNQMLDKSPDQRPATPQAVAAGLVMYAEGVDLSSLVEYSDEAIGESTANQGTDDDLSRGLTETVSQRSAEPLAEKGRSRKVLGTIVAVLCCAILATVIAIMTNRGTLIIESVDPDVRIVVQQQGELVKIIDLKTRSRLRLHSGEYQLILKSDRSGFELDRKSIRMTRGSEEVVFVRLIADDGTRALSKTSVPKDSTKRAKSPGEENDLRKQDAYPIPVAKTHADHDRDGYVPCHVPGYVMKDHPLAPEVLGLDVHGINNSGHIVGTCWTTETQESQAFRISDGKIADLRPVGVQDNAALAINDQGMAVGWYMLRTRDRGLSWKPAVFESGEMRNLFGDETHSGKAMDVNRHGQVTGESCEREPIPAQAFRFTGGEFITLGTLDGDSASTGFAINTHGHVVGRSTHHDGAIHGFFHDGHDMTRLRPLDDHAHCSATDINDAGMIVGWSAAASDQLGCRPVVWDEGQVQAIDTPGGGTGQATAVNSRGEVAGWFELRPGRRRAFVYHTGAVTDLHDQTWDSSRAAGINEYGEVVVYGTRGGKPFVVSVRPVPGQVITYDKPSDSQSDVFEANPELRRFREIVDGGNFNSPYDPDCVKLREELVAYRFHHRGTPPAIAAADLMAKLPWPADMLSPADIPDTERDAAADNSAALPPSELVAVFGDSRLRHWQASQQIVFSPDGTTLASSGSDGSIRLWDPKTGRLKRVWHLSGDSSMTAGCVAYSPDGTRFATSGLDEAIIVWDAKTGRRLCTVAGLGQIEFLGFSPDGQKIVAYDSRGRSIKVWDSQSGQQLGSFGEYPVTQARAMSADGKYFAVVADKDVDIWDMSKRELVHTISAEDAVRRLAFHPKNSMMAATTSENTLIKWDAETGKELGSWKLEVQSDSLTYTPDGEAIVVGCFSGKLLLWDVEKARARTELIGHHAAVYGIAVSQDGMTLASADLDGVIRVWDLPAGTERFGEDQRMEALTNVSVSTDGMSLVAGGASGSLHRWDLNTSEHQVLLQQAGKHVEALVSGTEGRQLACIGDPETQTIALWNLNEATHQQLDDLRSGWCRLAFDMDGGQLISADNDGEIRIRDSQSLETRRALFQPEGTVVAISLSPDQKLLATATRHGGSETIIWKTETGERVETLRFHTDRANQMDFSPDGERLASCGNSNNDSVRIFTFADRRSSSGVHEVRGGVCDVEFDPAGRVLLVAGGDGQLRFWDAVERRAVREPIALGPSAGGIREATFMPDGRHVVTVNGNGTIYVLRCFARQRK